MARISAQTQTQTFNSSGTFTVPAGVTSVTVEAWGGGGRGATRTGFNGAGGGGGGGAYSSKVISVSPGNYTVTVGAGGTSGTPAGGDSWFGTAATVMAKGGNAGSGTTGAAGGTAAASIGDTKFSGGTGSNSGGGGSSAGPAAAGNNGSGGTGATAPAGGGNGGGTFVAGSAPGGGGGSGAFGIAPGNGGNGKVMVTYDAPAPVFSEHPLPQNLGVGATLNLSINATLADSYQWKKNGVAIPGAVGPTYTKSDITAADAGHYSVDATNVFFTVSSNSAAIVVNPLPTLSPSPSASPICEGTSMDLSVGGNLNSTTTMTLISENFNAAANGWKTINNSTGGTPANAAWTLRGVGYLYIDPSFNFTFFASNDLSQFYLTNSQSQGAGTTSAILQSPGFSTMGMSGASVSFYQYYRSNGSETVKVEASTDGTTWNTLSSVATTQGSSTGFVQATVPLNAYAGQPTVYIRFKYDGGNDYYWAIDNVTVTGTMIATPVYSWTSDPEGFTSSDANPAAVFPDVNSSFYVTVTNHYGLSASGSTSVQVNPYQTFYADTDGDGYGDLNAPQDSCFGAPTGYVEDGTDCNDADNAMHAAFGFYADTDGDGFGAGAVVELCATDETTPPAGYSVNDTDCNDGDSALHENFPFYADNDADGYGAGEETLVCALDAVTPPGGFSVNGTDCNDEAANAYPGALEIGYDLIDNDCDGLTDEGFPPKVTVLQTAMCDVVLPEIDTQLVANLVAGAQGYRWRVTTMSGPTAGEIQFLDTPLRAMRIIQLASYAFDTTYKIELGVYYAGFLQPYQISSCTVTTPAPVTQLIGCESGIGLTNIGDAVFCDLIPFASGYRFRVTDPLQPLFSQELERPLREFRMNNVTAFPIQYGKTYNVETAIRNTDGSYLPYGSICTVNTPLFPTTSIQDLQCDNGVGGPYAVPDYTTPIVAVSYPGAIAYAFRLVGSGLPPEGAVAVKSTRVCTLNDFAGSGIISGQSYNISVRLVFNWTDIDGPYGKVCMITVPGLTRELPPAQSFKVLANPNPFTGSTSIALQSESEMPVRLKVHDMTGRILETREMRPSQFKSFQIGERYPSGVYMVTITQNNNTSTVRIIKR